MASWPVVLCIYSPLINEIIYGKISVKHGIRATGAYCVFLNNNLISWSSISQPIVSRSSAEAEYCGVANAVVDLVGFEISFVSYILPLSQRPPLCIVITLVQYTFLRIQFNTKGQNILRLTFTSPEKKLLLAKSVSYTSFLFTDFKDSLNC